MTRSLRMRRVLKVRDWSSPINVLAGSSSGMDAFISDVVPEQAALRPLAVR